MWIIASTIRQTLPLYFSRVPVSERTWDQIRACFLATRIFPVFIPSVTSAYNSGQIYGMDVASGAAVAALDVITSSTSAQFLRF
ncbi:uncharacterized protein LOC112350599 isoform X2 [Selaginella moellendorffii]|uniref:uncharacterized protein LOC112350599 isoform X2 n=1 Tax=Selaginella moellendorffii TaxID=88036 RepID=UPI000D1C8932|nr:uncharacterized protein LOC112350599 isoform X2 [Selaginella moellendorffii]|eukprot:XP_024542814.1 uncharacterized protein LOC112350599 isoform X2 [Selaginella moellendorffii]